MAATVRVATALLVPGSVLKGVMVCAPVAAAEGLRLGMAESEMESEGDEDSVKEALDVSDPDELTLGEAEVEEEGDWQGVWVLLVQLDEDKEAVS